VVALPGIDEPALLLACAALERASGHPLARAVVEGVRERLGDVALEEAREFESRTGQGVLARVGSRQVAIGNLALLSALGVDTAPLAPRMAERAAGGGTRRHRHSRRCRRGSRPHP
jgi:Cu+-exporting ATPase